MFPPILLIINRYTATADVLTLLGISSITMARVMPIHISPEKDQHEWLHNNCTIRVAKTKALISFTVTAKLICVFVFAYVKCRFSHDAAHITWAFRPVKTQISLVIGPF